MQKLTVEEIRKRFELSKEFNEIFDAFEQAIGQRLQDIELYRQLFWNHTLTPDEICLFGEKLSKELPDLAAADCYEPDLNIPPIDALIDFLKQGVNGVSAPKSLYLKLAHLYELNGNDEMYTYFRKKGEEAPPGPGPAGP